MAFSSKGQHCAHKPVQILRTIWPKRDDPIKACKGLYSRSHAICAWANQVLGQFMLMQTERLTDQALIACAHDSIAHGFGDRES